MQSVHHSCQIEMKLYFLDRFFLKNPKISNFITIRPLGAELFHADRHTNGQTDMTESIVAFRNSANAPKDKKTNTSQYHHQNQ